ncbi:hypothetical protein D3C71_2203110 [compost metagenome]
MGFGDLVIVDQEIGEFRPSPPPNGWRGTDYLDEVDRNPAHDGDHLRQGGLVDAQR